MATEVIKTIKGRQYRYLQRSVRVPGRRTPKTESIYIGPVGGSTRKTADEKYRQVLRDNAYKYGRSRPGERYASEARAREQYHRDMGFRGADASKPPLTREELYRQAVSGFWLNVDSNKRSNFEMRHSAYTASHPTARYRVSAEFQRVRDEVRQEDARVGAQNAPGGTQETPAKNFTVDDEIEARHASFERTVDEYNAGTTAAPDSPAPADAPSPDGQGQPSAPSGDAGPSSSDGP